MAGSPLGKRLSLPRKISTSCAWLSMTMEHLAETTGTTSACAAGMASIMPPIRHVAIRFPKLMPGRSSEYPVHADTEDVQSHRLGRVPPGLQSPKGVVRNARMVELKLQCRVACEIPARTDRQRLL